MLFLPITVFKLSCPKHQDRLGVSDTKSPFFMSKKPFALTYIEYDEESGVFGWVMALMSLSPVYALRRLSHDSASLCALSAPPSSSIAISTPASCFWRWYDSLLPVFCSSPAPY